MRRGRAEDPEQAAGYGRTTLSKRHLLPVIPAQAGIQAMGTKTAAAATITSASRLGSRHRGNDRVSNPSCSGLVDGYADLAHMTTDPQLLDGHRCLVEGEYAVDHRFDAMLLHGRQHVREGLGGADTGRMHRDVAG